MERTLDAVRDDGLRVVRLWALGEREEGAPEWARDFAFRVGEEGWVEASFEHLDRAIAAARERDLRVIVVLANRWRDYGGLPQYLRWAGVPFDDVPGAPTDLELSRFWTCERCDALYRAHVRRVVGRVNSVTGVPYRDDPTIFAWELVNESSAQPRAAASLVEWTQRAARFVRELDPNHMIAAGHIGYERASARSTWLAVQRLPEIAYADAHAYPTAYDRVRDPAELARFVDDRVQLAHHVARKPFVWGEFGFSTRARRVLGLPRARWYDAFLRASHRDGAAGALVWTYAPFEDRPREHGIHPDGEGARGTRDVRAVLARHASRWRSTPPEERNPSLGDAIGETPLHVAAREVRGAPRVHDGWARDGSLHVPIAGFARARFEAVGSETGGAIAHLWGAGRGQVVYRFRAPPGPAPSFFSLSMSASSELPGRGIGATPEDGSRVAIRIDGERVGEIDLPPDDAIGRRVHLAIADRDLLARLFSRPRAAHELALEVVPEVGAEGLCLYGAATGAEPVPPEIAADLTGAIELAWDR
jgi:mannan endo-1,4-beta-mannosidase